MTWKIGNEQTTRGYRFEYDPLSRLKTAAYGEGEILALKPNHYDEQITGYDKNGNVQGIKRYGQTSASTCGLIDNLSISLNGNQLQSVNDAVTTRAFNGNFEFKNDSRQTEKYAYDTNGNLIKDLNKKITTIQYNHLNLPNRIEFENGSSISYLYDATGAKLRVVHQMEENTTSTDYCGNVIYENGVPKTLLTEAGFVSLTDNKYHYYLQDHQGNNRVVADQDEKVEEVNHYYPFGGVFASTSSVQPYKYNGKELDRKGGLDWYDYGARHYDAALGRWQAVDPMAEEYYAVTPYAYCLNNPGKFIDINGKDVWVKFIADGTYRIVGGTRNTDLNIYTVNASGNRTENVIGKTFTEYSFFGDNGKVVDEAIININDQSGQNFIDKEIIADNPNILYYMPNAVGGQKYDFKTRGMGDAQGNAPDKYQYRGMPFKNADGETAYASARDIGNYGAGYIAGKTGLDWKTARIGFDALQSYQDGHLSTEGMTTKQAEYRGYEAGSSRNWLSKANDWLRRLFNTPTSIPNGFLNY